MSPPDGRKSKAVPVPQQRGAETELPASVPGQSVTEDDGEVIVSSPLCPEDTFVPWYRDNFDRLARRAILACGGPEDAKALIHDVCINLLKKLSEGAAPFETKAFEKYAEKSVTNEIISYSRRNSTKPRHVPIEENDGRHEDPESFEEEKVALWRVLEELPEKERKVIELFFYDGMKPAEIAKEIGLKPQSVSTYKSNGLRKMREHPAIAQLIENND
jgi:RNA polymerase sigma factor (sigma-70 family)